MCNDCDTMFTTTEIVNMALILHKSNKAPNVLLPMHARRRDIASYRYPYDCEATDTHEDKFWTNKEVRFILLRQQVDEHNYNHWPSCFKKESE